MSGQPEELETSVDVAIGRAVVRLRTSAGWTQQELADHMRTRGWPWTQPAVAKVELGKRPVRLAEAKDLAQLLGVKTQDLLASPLDDTISTLRSREGEAMRLIEKATQDASRARQQYRTLDEIRRAAAGERIYFGPSPLLGVADAFGQLPWSETCAILRQLGASEPQIAQLTKIYRRTNESNLIKLMEANWELLQALVPNLHTDPE